MTEFQQMQHIIIMINLLIYLNKNLKSSMD